MKLYFVYILQCRDDSYYVGMSSDLGERIIEHNSGKFPEAYTYTRRPVILKWIEKFTDPDQALEREKQIKGWSRKKKEALIIEDWDKLIEYSRNSSFKKWFLFIAHPSTLRPFDPSTSSGLRAQDGN